MPFPLTEEQRKIVDDRGGELLVSAAAGSGKTRVLVERLLDRVTREGLDMDRFLVITYTKAAAAELRGRIAQELSDRLGEQPTDPHLRRQTTLVYKTQISTIHAFCAALLRENGHMLDLDGDFRLCDEGESAVIRSSVLEDVLDSRYENLEEDSPFTLLADTLGAGRDDSRLAQITMDIFLRVQSHPDPRCWLEEQKKLWGLEGISDLSETPWGALLLEDAKRQAEFCRERIVKAISLAVGDELLEQNYVPSLSATLEELEGLLRAKSWDEAASHLPVPFPTAGRKKKRKVEVSPMTEEEANQAGEALKAIRTRCKKLLDKVAEGMEGDTAQLLEELSLSRPVVQALMDLVLDFGAAYAKEKRRRGVLDFSDLEHFAVELLVGEDGLPTQLAQIWSSRYEEILVDEYQDTNQVQNAIFYAISDEGRKLFEVGDVKQSIYRFRLADPTIFLDKYRRFPMGNEGREGEPRKRLLSRNFRSRSQVLEGCNDLFRSIMSTEMGELDYTDDQALVPGKEFPGEPGDYALELDALDLSFLDDQEGEKESKDLLEARFAAQRIRELLEKPLMIEEGDGLRPLRTSDIMILLRSPGTVLSHYIRALNEQGIAWNAEGGKDFFETTEVQVALAILQIVDNPHQDVPLIAALRSPVYGFSGDKLSMLRADSDGDFYTALVKGAEQGDEDCVSFLQQLQELRFGAGERTCRQLIWHIYEKTNLLGLFGAMEAGTERRSNLLALYALAGQMEESGCRTLFPFLLRLQRLREMVSHFSAPGGGEGEGVSILSIHRSKGLEKPVVLVCGLTRRLNREDLRKPVLFHPVLGVGPKGLDRERMVEYETVARRGVKRQLEREMMAEELRLLYVAMTRAREKLILTAALPDGLRALERLGEDLSLPISPMTLEQQQSVGAWVLLHALTRPEGEALRTLAGVPEMAAENLGPGWDIRWVDGQSLMEVSHQEGTFTDLPEEGTCVGEDELRERLFWTYPHQKAAFVPSKLTATQIKGRTLDQEAVEDAAPPSRKGKPLTRPEFIAREKGLTPAQRGIALHLAMQYLSLDGDHSIRAIEKELDQLQENGYLTPLQREAVSPQRLAAFWQSPLGMELSTSRQCRREFKFSLLVPARDYYPSMEEEEILLQGVIDVWFEGENGLTVLDFKTDRVRPGQERAKAEEYRPQLEAYGKALSQILGRKVKKTVLWFFETDTAVEI